MGVGRGRGAMREPTGRISGGTAYIWGGGFADMSTGEVGEGTGAGAATRGE